MSIVGLVVMLGPPLAVFAWFDKRERQRRAAAFPGPEPKAKAEFWIGLLSALVTFAVSGYIAQLVWRMID